MNAPERRPLMSIKGRSWRHSLLIGAAGAALAAILGLNMLAFFRGLESPWLLGAIMLADVLVIGSGVLVAARAVVTAEHRTEAAEAQYEAIIDSAMDAIISVDESQRILLFNRAAESIFRCPRSAALGKPLERFIPERFRAAHRGHIEAFAHTGVTGRRMGELTTLRGLRADGDEFAIEASISQAGAPGNRQFTVILRDVSLRQQQEAEAERVRGALSDAQARLTAIVDSAMDAVITVDEAQKIVLFNRAAEQVFGLPREQVLGAPLDRLIPARFRGAHHAHVESFGATGVTSRRMGDVTTLWALRADGSEFPIEASISQVAEHGRRYYTVILRDITLRKQAEDALKRQQRELRELSAAVLEAREEEKTRIARELHDELGQLLTAVKMDLTWLHDKLGAGAPEVTAKVREMGAIVDQTVGAVRRISADLRPLMLDDLGLADAAGWLVEEFAKRSSVRCSYKAPEEDALEEVSKAAGTAIYRALQESLTNIARHSGAKNAWVQLAAVDGEVHFEVEDDGRGIAPQDMAKARSLGLKGMRERLAYLGGSLEISAAPRGGTRLRGRVPASATPEKRE
jgi:PAS domain S-box-containing protein